jgi:hypothetical protein
VSSPTVALDDDGNALSTWSEMSTAPALSYYDASKGSWSAVVRPSFSGDSLNGAVPRLRGAHAVALFGAGVAETTNGQTWTTTEAGALLGSSSYFGPAGISIAGDDTVAIVWTDSHEFKPASLWSAFHSPGAAWQVPTTAFVDPETYSFQLHELPDNSFLAVYEHRLDQVTPGNFAARRYTKSKGWSNEKQIAAGAEPVSAFDSFGNALLIGASATPVARYDYTADQWTAMPDVVKVNEDMQGLSVALAGDGTGFAAYVGGSFNADDDHVGLQRLIGNKWSPEEILLPTTTDTIILAGIAADDCGDVEVVWSNGTKSIAYARRYTPASGWLPTVTLTKIAPSSYANQIAGNAHGELIVPYTTSEASSTLAPRVRRFE